MNFEPPIFRAKPFQIQMGAKYLNIREAINGVLTTRSEQKKAEANRVTPHLRVI